MGDSATAARAVLLLARGDPAQKQAPRLLTRYVAIKLLFVFRALAVIPGSSRDLQFLAWPGTGVVHRPYGLYGRPPRKERTGENSMGEQRGMSRRQALISGGLAAAVPVLPAIWRTPSVVRSPDAVGTPLSSTVTRQLWHNEQTGAGVSAPWTGWHVLSQPGNAANVVQLACHADGRMHAVMAGLDNQVWHNEQTAVGV